MAEFYVGIVDSGGEGWGVTFPDLPGCFSGGRTMDDLFSMSVEAVRLWAENVAVADLPRPRPLDVLLADPDVAAAVQAVGPVFFIQVPLLRDSGRSVRANVSFDAGLLDAIDAAAKRRGLTRSAFLASAVRTVMESGV